MNNRHPLHLAVLLDQNREEWWRLTMMQTWLKKFRRPIKTQFVVFVRGGLVAEAIEELLDFIAASNVLPGMFTLIISPIHGSKNGGSMLWSKTTTQAHSSKKPSDYEISEIQDMLPVIGKAQIRRVHLHYCLSSQAMNIITIHSQRPSYLRPAESTALPPYNLSIVITSIIDVEFSSEKDHALAGARSSTAEDYIFLGLPISHNAQDRLLGRSFIQRDTVGFFGSLSSGYPHPAMRTCESIVLSPKPLQAPHRPMIPKQRKSPAIGHNRAVSDTKVTEMVKNWPPGKRFELEWKTKGCHDTTISIGTVVRADIQTNKHGKDAVILIAKYDGASEEEMLPPGGKYIVWSITEL